jgi:hypothetical protein
MENNTSVASLLQDDSEKQRQNDKAKRKSRGKPKSKGKNKRGDLTVAPLKYTEHARQAN